ncbi:MAG: D-glycerate dehydrogenase [Phycisphaerae bacterium]
MQRHRVLITRQIPSPAAEMIRAGGHDLNPIDADEPLPRALLLQALRGVSGVICVLSDRIDDEALAAAGPSLRVVSNLAVGFENIDLAACKQRGVRATNTPDVLTDATAELAWALILAAARHVVPGDRLTRGGQWSGWSPTQMRGLELCGSTLGIVGAGRIGTATALRGVGFGMKLVYAHPRSNPALDAVPGTTRLDLDDVLRAADVVSLHVPMRPENRHLLDARRLALLQTGAILINTARGAVIDEAALVDVLRRRQIAGAGMDVYEHEPRLASGLAELDNVVLLPHLGSATIAARERMSRMAAENVLAVLAGHEPPNALC